MKYFLGSSIADRLNFERMVRSLVWEDIKMLSKDQLKECLDDLDNHVNRMTEMYLEFGFNFEDPDSSNYIDDYERAKEIFSSTYKESFLEEAGERLKKEREQSIPKRITMKAM